MGCGAVQNPQASQPFPKNNPNHQVYLDNKQQKSKPTPNKVENLYPRTDQKVTMDRAYQVFQLLGKGTYGQVYRCVKNDTMEEFALKIVKMNAKNKEQAKRHINNLKSQISVLKKLSHPNIIKYYSFDISPDNQTVEIVFELVSGGSLKDYITKNGKLTQAEASRFCKQILEGLNYLHEKSIIHRDLKCANILIGEEGAIKITDFGTAKEIKVKSHQDIAKLCASLKGTPYYMAPQILKRAGHHKSADIWSFGCTLIQMLTGKPPWTMLTQNFQEIISYIISGIPPPLPPNISKECEFFLQSCFDSVPSQRLTARQLSNHRFILNNTQISSPSLVYENPSPKMSGKSVASKATKKKAEEVQVTELNSIEITRRKKSTLEDVSERESSINTQNAFKKNHPVTAGKPKKSSLFLDSPKFNDKSEPFLNYYGATKSKDIQFSDPYVPKNGKQSKKSAKSELKKVAKTAGHVKMTEENLLNWNQIEEQMLSNQKSSNYDYSSRYETSNNTLDVKNSKKSRTNTQNAVQQNDQAINTTLAKEQRDRYIENQKKLKQKKQEEKRKWEEQLKKQSQTKHQITHRHIKEHY